MARPVTLFTGQWADLPLEQVAESTSAWGFDGLELACWGDHFEVDRALDEPGYCSGVREVLERHGLEVWAIGAHLVGQAVCDPIDDRHRGILPPEVWGDGDPEGVRRRAAERMQDTARAAARLGVTVVTGFTGSSIWHWLYSFPPNDFAAVDHGYEDFAERWGPIVDVFDAEGVRFALEVHPTEIAYDAVTTRKALAAIDHRPGFGINFDPSHLIPQFLDPAAFIEEFADRIYHVHVKDSRRNLNGRRWRRSTTGPASASTSIRATSPTSTWTRPPSRSSSPTASTTCTSRTRASAWTGAARSWAPTSTSARSSAAGTSSHPVTATSTSGPSSAP